MREPAPVTIMLQWVGCDEINDDGEEPAEVTWSEDAIYDTDTAYIRSDIAESRAALLIEALESIQKVFTGDAYAWINTECMEIVDKVDDALDKVDDALARDKRVYR